MKEIKLPIDFIDNFILKAKPEHSMVFLYAFRNKEENKTADIEQMAVALNMHPDTVREAVEYWCGVGYDIFNVKKFPPKPLKSKYTPDEITKFSDGDSELALLYEETEKIMNKPLSTNDQQTLFWIYNDLGMSTCMIILLINYAKTINKCTMRYIEKTAFEWSENGICTYEDADKYIQELERANSYEAKLKKLFELDRNFIATEKAVIAGWCNDLKPTKEQLLKAYEICIERTGKFSAKYMNAILVNWKEENKKTPKPSTSVPTPKATKFNNIQTKSGIDYKKLELEALRRRLSRSKEGAENG